MKSKTNKTELKANNTAVFPMRINKYLAYTGVSTRVGADVLIKEGKVFINGVLAKLGDKVSKDDKVLVKENKFKENSIYLAYNKPKGIVSTNAQNDEVDILESIKNIRNKYKNIFPVGRIDKESHGLMILTNDGRVTDKLLNPKYDHEKEYVVKLDRNYSDSFLKHMQNGVDLGDEITKKAKVKRINENTFNITLTEGKNRQIRRMTEKLGYTVRDLQRVRVQNIKLGKLPQNSVKEITGEEKLIFLESLGLK